MYLNKLIQKRRLELGLSQVKLAKMLSFKGGQIISNIERGACGFPKKRLKRLCRALLLDQATVLQAVMTDERKQIEKLLGVK